MAINTLKYVKEIRGLSMNKTDQEWAKFGKKLYDNALKCYKDYGAPTVVVPLAMEPYGEVLTVSFHIRTFCMATGPIDDRYKSTKTGYPLSDGTIEWEKEVTRGE